MDGFGFLVADIDAPDGDFVTVLVVVGLRAVKDNAAPGAGVGGILLDAKAASL